MTKSSVHLMSGKLKSPVTHKPLYKPFSTALAATAIDLLIAAALSVYFTLSSNVRAFKGGRLCDEYDIDLFSSKLEICSLNVASERGGIGVDALKFRIYVVRQGSS
ncbi:hypothetical protein BpHYR1_023541 [Brachionus plicatilis]|uniref:Uncharacterized protein n=1 Tax=Brachionus plicatilis TaxID=10195 RepID=A0A3M7SUK5_BRAPC|nr:hypothetical protein BpHYR1_023541 [Brachionus plicatilis]